VTGPAIQLNAGCCAVDLAKGAHGFVRRRFCQANRICRIDSEDKSLGEPSLILLGDFGPKAHRWLSIAVTSGEKYPC
jgi:hypothetical protein